MSRTDLELLARYASDRDAQAFAELVARHRDMVYAACYRILGSRAEAEDSAQDCFLALARSARSIKTCVAGWLHRVAVRHSLAIRRADRARRDREREAATMRPDDGTEPSWDDIESEVDRAIDALPDTLREPVVLHFLEGKPQTAIAEDLGISQPAVCMRIKKGLERLRKHFERNGLTLSAAAVAALLGAHASEAAPPTLLPSTGKMALAGITSGPAKGIVAGSALGRAAVICSKAKIACAVAASLVAAAVLQQTVLDTSVAGECPTTSRGLLRGATSGPTAATRPQMNQPPLGSEPAPPATPQGQAAAEPQPAVTTAQAAVQQPPTPAPRPPGMTLSLSPTGAITITDDEGLVATLWLIAFGTGWNPWDQ
ncbi:MAG: RNA polymerase sigma factor, partial [Armatimonadota bacterium]